jgi:WhiB family transcriptional regulator, redox-sensing transcriptional regulator
MAIRRNWRVSARCRTGDAEGLFVTGARQREARSLCQGCPVRTECLAHALDHRVEFGVWGGMTERQRRALLRSRPDVTSWTELLLAAREAHYAPRADDGSTPRDGAGTPNSGQGPDHVGATARSA